MKRAFRRVGRWLAALCLASNHWGNALLGGEADMTISARAGYARAKGSKVGAGMCHFLDWTDHRDGDDPVRGDHCDIAVANYEARGKNR